MTLLNPFLPLDLINLVRECELLFLVTDFVGVDCKVEAALLIEDGVRLNDVVFVLLVLLVDGAAFLVVVAALG